MIVTYFALYGLLGALLAACGVTLIDNPIGFVSILVLVMIIEAVGRLKQ